MKGKACKFLKIRNKMHQINLLDVKFTKKIYKKIGNKGN